MNDRTGDIIVESGRFSGRMSRTSSQETSCEDGESNNHSLTDFVACVGL